MFNNPFPNAFGLDISDLSIKVVQLKNVSKRKKPQFQVKTFRSVDLPPGLIANGELQQPEKVRKYLQRVITGFKKGDRPLGSPWVVASLPEPQSFIKLIHIPKSPDEIFEEEIINIAKKHIPFDESDVFIDWQIIPNNEDEAADTTRVLIVAAPQSITKNYTYLFESVGLNVIALEIEALAIARAMITAGKTYTGEARALLDLGATHSSLVIYDHNIVQFSISLPFSGEIITTALSQRLKIPHEEAEQKKKYYGLYFDKNDTKGKKAWAVTADMANMLLEEVQKAIQFYYSHFEGANNITKIVMCGGAANMKRLDEILTHKLHIPCTKGTAWKNLGKIKKSQPKKTPASDTQLPLVLRLGPQIIHSVGTTLYNSYI